MSIPGNVPEVGGTSLPFQQVRGARSMSEVKQACSWQKKRMRNDGSLRTPLYPSGRPRECLCRQDTGKGSSYLWNRITPVEKIGTCIKKGVPSPSGNHASAPVHRLPLHCFHVGQLDLRCGRGSVVAVIGLSPVQEHSPVLMA